MNPPAGGIASLNACPKVARGALFLRRGASSAWTRPGPTSTDLLVNHRRATPVLLGLLLLGCSESKGLADATAGDAGLTPGSDAQLDASLIADAGSTAADTGPGAADTGAIATDGGTNADAGSTGDTGSTAADASTSSCAAPASFALPTLTDLMAAGEGTVTERLNLEASAQLGGGDQLSLLFYSDNGVFGASLQPGTYAIAGDELNFATCGLCIFLDANLAPPAPPEMVYFATGGSVEITEIGANFRAVLRDLSFEQVTIDQGAPYATHAVPGGCRTHIGEARFDVPINR